jgi:hypothetical protein
MAKTTTKAAPPTSIALIDAKAPLLLDLASRADTAKVLSEAYVIDSPEMFEVAAEQLAAIRKAEKEVEEAQVKITKPLHDAKTAAIALFKPISNMLAAAKQQLGRKMIAYEDIEKARVRAAETAALMQRQAEIAAAQGKLEETTVALQAGTATIADMQEAITDVMVAEVSLPVAHVEAPVTRGGHARTKRWVAEIVSLPLLLRYLADRLEAGDPVFDNTVDIKLGQLQAFAASSQGKLAIPGVSFTSVDNMTARAG